MKIHYALWISIFALSRLGFATVGKLEKLAGELTVFSMPTEELSDLIIDENEVTVQFEGRYWKSKILHAGDEVNLNDVLNCKSDCKASIRLNSGSLLLLNKNSILVVSDKFLKESKEPTFFDLIFGSLRAVIVKEHNKHSEFRAQTAVIGIRGTDFFVNSQLSESKVSVLEGEIGVKTKVLGHETKTVNVKQGAEATISHPSREKIEELGKMDEKAQANALNTFQPQKPKPITLSALKEIKNLSHNLIANDKKIKILEKRLTHKTKMKVNEPKQLALGLEFGHPIIYDARGYNDKMVDYSLFALVFEYQFENKPYGLGAYFSILDLKNELFRMRGFQFDRISASALALRGFYNFAPLRVGIDLNLGGTLELANSSTKKSYDLSGYAFHIEYLYDLTEFLNLRPRLGYRYLGLNSHIDREIDLFGIEVGFAGFLRW